MTKTNTLIYFLLFIFLYIIFRYLSPFGYEPDFWIRAPEYIQLNGAIKVNNLFIYNHNIPIISEIIRNLNINSICNIESVRLNFKDHLISGTNENSPLSFFQKIDHKTCTQSLEQIFLRTLLLILLTLPFWIIFFMKNNFFKVLKFFSKNIEYNLFSKNIDSIILSFFFSGMLYYIGVIAYEQLTLLIALTLIFFYRSILIIIPLLLILFIDFGNSFLLLSVFTLAYIFTFIFYKFKYKYFLFLIFSLIIISCIFSFDLLKIFQIDFISRHMPYFFSNYIYSIYNHHYIESLNQSYPLFVRPIIFFMTFVYWTPGNIKIILSYLFIGFLFFHFFIKYNYELSIFKIFKVSNLTQKDLFHQIFTNNLIISILIIILILPMYCNAKYYIFVLPFIIRTLLNYYSRNHILLIFLVLSLINFSHLLIYRFL